MNDIEQAFRDGLDDAVKSAPRLGPVDLDAVLAQGRAARVPARRVTWLAIAAVTVLVAGLSFGLWFSASRGADPRIVAVEPAQPTPTGVTPTTGPTRALEGTRWEATAVDGVAVLEGVRVPDLQLVDETVTATDGCNGLRGAYRLDGDRLRITDVLSTLVGCQQSAAAGRQQRAYAQGLDTTTRWQVDGSTLTLFDASGVPVLVFRASEDSDPAPSTALPTTVIPTQPSTASPATKVQVRVRNNSDRTMENVQVAFGAGESAPYGTVVPGGATPYFVVGQAFSYGSVHMVIDGRKRVWQPVDYVGETPLPPGRYTYVLTASDSDETVGLRLETDR